LLASIRFIEEDLKVMKKTKLPKGQHEEEVENVKDLLHRGMGVIEIVGLTSLNEEEVIEINNTLK
jgi:MoaA/NifB/PqqE/SkfB family radical SAM enzyme